MWTQDSSRPIGSGTGAALPARNDPHLSRECRERLQPALRAGFQQTRRAHNACGRAAFTPVSDYKCLPWEVLEENGLGPRPRDCKNHPVLPLRSPVFGLSPSRDVGTTFPPHRRRPAPSNSVCGVQHQHRFFCPDKKVKGQKVPEQRRKRSAAETQTLQENVKR